MPFAAGSGFENKERNVRTDCLGNFREGFARQVCLQDSIERQQGRSRVTAPAAQPGAVRNFLCELNRDAALLFCGLKEPFGRPHYKIVVVTRNRSVITLKIDPPRLSLDFDLVIERDPRDKRLDFMKAVIPPTHTTQQQL